MPSINLMTIEKVLKNTSKKPQQADQIIFKSEQEAQDYAKKRVIEALKAEPPFERAVLVQKNKVIDEFDGSQYSVPFDPKNYKEYQELSIIHGHPDTFEKGKATPISSGDIDLLLFNDNINTVQAYSSVGEHSTITRKTGFWNKVKTFFARTHSYSDSNNLVKKLLPQELKERKKTLLLNIKKGNFDIDEPERIQQEILKAVSSKDASLKIHQYLTKTMPKYGLDYTTNYSYLV